jgi:hypothetical protein
MKLTFPAVSACKLLVAALTCSLLLSHTASATDKTPKGFAPFATGRKIYVNKGGDNGIYINGSNYSYAPGDTLVLRASQNPYSYFSLENIHGQSGAPVVVINEGGQVQISAMAAKNCTFLKITGTGNAANQYGFFLTSPNQTVSAPAFDINERSADIEVDHADINTHGYGFWVKQEASCPDSLRYPNWRIANISIHDNRITNTGQEGIYAGSTAPNGERSVYCNGATIFPLPLRLGNIKIYNNIIDHTGRGGIQLSSADYGNNEIYNNTITNCGYGFDPAQGNGIVLGGYTTAYVHDNSIDYTYSSGIFSLGAGLVRIENNRVDHSGLLAGSVANGSANIMVDTRFTSPVTNTLFYIKNNTLGTNSDINIRVYISYAATYALGNIVCGNLTTSGAAAGANIPMSVNWVGCTGVANLTTANAGPDQTIAIPVTSVQLAGSGSVTTGAISTYAWSQVSGPSTAIFSSATSASTSASGLIQGTYTFRLKVTDNSGANATDDVSVTVTAPAASTYLPVPGKIEAEGYVAMYGIQTETTLDAGAGQNVGWQDNYDWMDYNVNVAAPGIYTVSFRVATTNTGAQFQLRNASGTALATVTVPNTGGWQAFQTVTAQVTLPAGQQTLRVYTTVAQGSGWNFNWMDFAAVSTTPVAPAITYTAVPGRVEAEAYTTMSGIQTENTGDAGGGQDVGWQENNDWEDYAVNIATAATYTVSFRVATVNTGVTFQLRKSDGTSLATVTVPNTGWWQTYQTVTAQVTLPAGQQTLRVYTTNAQGSGWNFNWMEFATASTTITPPETTTTQRIEAESYTTMSGIQTENTSDAGGGLNVGWQENNDWMDYSVSVATAGTYTVNFRVATVNTGVTFQLRKADGTSLATVTVPNTGWWQTYQTVSAQVTLAAGQQTLRIFTTNAQGSGWNFNWWELVGPSSTTTPPVTTFTQRIEAESYATMYGIQTENTSDAGGGLNVGWQENNDWEDYSVTIPTAGTYTVNFRIATVNTGVQVQLRNASGTALTTVTVPNTGWWQTYQTVSAQVTLPAGQQTLRVFTSNAQGSGWNFNWWEITNAAAKTANTGTVELVAVDNTALEVFPLQVTDRFSLKVDNNLTGSMSVSVLDAAGTVQKTFTVSKPSAGATQTYLSITDLPKGQYTLQVKMTGWTQSTNIEKL